MPHLRKFWSADARVGTGALARPVEQSSTGLLRLIMGGRPALARFLRKGGNSSSLSYGLLTLAALSAAIAFASGCRLDMQVQPKENPLSKNDFYADQRSERPPVEGTVARDDLRQDAYFHTGKIGNNPGDVMPFTITKEVLDHGRERFNIYCAPCHSRLGDGNGFVPSRGFSRKPPSFHIARLQKAPLGYFFDVITNGFGIMPDYASQIPPQDRWDIIAYIRALQLSQNATMSDVPAGQPVPSEPPKFREPGSGATLPVLAPETKSSEEKSQNSKQNDLQSAVTKENQQVNQ
jgi:mono/diheme cytochrome c family protein